MVKAIMVLIISIFFLLITFLIKRSYEKDKLEEENLKHTTATIEKVIFSDTGNVKYYVLFKDNQKQTIAQTVHYTSETKSLNPGDKVDIGYFYTKTGRPMAKIFDDRVIPCSNSVPKIYKLFNIIGIVLFIIAIVMIIRAI